MIEVYQRAGAWHFTAMKVGWNRKLESQLNRFDSRGYPASLTRLDSTRTM
jgi:hypothetical protein